MSNKQMMIIVSLILLIGIGIIVTIVIVTNKPVKDEVPNEQYILEQIKQRESQERPDNTQVADNTLKRDPVNQNEPIEITNKSSAIEQDYKDNEYKVSRELQNCAAMINQYYNCPESIGGADKNPLNVTIPKIIAFTGHFDGPQNSHTTNDGEFRLIASSYGIVTLKGMGIIKKDNQFALVTTKVNCNSGVIETRPGKGTEF